MKTPYNRIIILAIFVSGIVDELQSVKLPHLPEHDDNIENKSNVHTICRIGLIRFINQWWK